MNMSELEYRKPLQWGEIDPYRRGRTHVGMWAWLLQRVTVVTRYTPSSRCRRA